MSRGGVLLMFLDAATHVNAAYWKNSQTLFEQRLPISFFTP
jgi:hypothetical protein